MKTFQHLKSASNFSKHISFLFRVTIIFSQANLLTCFVKLTTENFLSCDGLSSVKFQACSSGVLMFCIDEIFFRLHSSVDIVFYLINPSGLLVNYCGTKIHNVWNQSFWRVLLCLQSASQQLLLLQKQTQILWNYILSRILTIWRFWKIDFVLVE